ncbi:hypothetical protein D3C85_694510 [compost metagenome]
MTTENLFELASRQKIRFASSKGDLTVEQLWDLPLSSKVGFDLDSVAREVNSKLKAAGEESFVETRVNLAKARLELAMELVKHIIGVRLAEREANLKSMENKAERARLTEILHSKKDDELKGLSVEELEARIANLK